MTAYRERYADITKAQATVIAISTDDAETQAKFKASLKAPYSFVADADAKVVKAFDVKTPVLTLAKRVTFVVGPGRRVLSKQEGSDALEPSGAVRACSLAPPESLKFVTVPDAGAPVVR